MLVLVGQSVVVVVLVLAALAVGNAACFWAADDRYEGEPSDLARLVMLGAIVLSLFAGALLKGVIS